MRADPPGALLAGAIAIGLAWAGSSMAEEAVGRRVLFVGDTSFGETYQEQMARRGATNILEAEGYGYSLGGVEGLLASADVVVANLETPLTDLDRSPFATTKRYVHRGDVRRTPEALVSHGIGVVSLANNHALDYGAEGLRQTLATLRAHGIDSVGAGLDASAAARPLVRSLAVGDSTFRLAVVAGFEYAPAQDQRYRAYAGEKRPGTNGWTPESAARQVRELRASDPESFIVAFPHWGANYRWRSTGQRTLARALVDAGADLVVGHGAHLCQEIERYGNRWIVYGLGNFVFNSPGRYSRLGVHPYSLAAALDLLPGDGGPRLRLRLYPLYSDNQMTVYRPHPVSEEQFDRVRRLLVNRTADLERLATAGRDGIGGYLEIGVD